MLDTLGTQKEGAFELKLRPVAVLLAAVTVLLRGSCSDVCGERPGARALGPGSWAQCHLPLWRLAGGLTSLCLSFLLFKMELIRVAPAQEGHGASLGVNVCEEVRARVTRGVAVAVASWSQPAHPERPRQGGLSVTWSSERGTHLAGNEASGSFPVVLGHSLGVLAGRGAGVLAVVGASEAGATSCV